MVTSARLTVVSRYIARGLIIGTIFLEFISFPLVLIFEGLLSTAPSLSQATKMASILTLFLPFAAIGIMVLCLQRLETHRKLYPITALLLVAAWFAILVGIPKISSANPIIVYALWHMEVAAFIFKLFGYSV